MPNSEYHAYLLVVDDDENNRHLLTRRLGIEDYRTAAAADGHEALQMIEEEDFDLILLDVMMPGISGLEVLQILRKTHTVADLPVIMATAKDASENIVEALSLGASDYVTKPIDMPVLLARIESHLALKSLSETKNEFLRIASHDLKSPLQAALSSATLIAQEVTPGSVMDEEMYEFVSIIQARIEQMQTIIEDFLDFQAFTDGRLDIQRTETDVNEIVQTVVERNAEYARRKQIDLRCELTDSISSIQADPARLEQVIENLVNNSVKFGHPNSESVVKTQGDKNSVILEVRDTGPGLKPEDLKKLFLKYARLSNKPTGGEVSTGLGLAICKTLIDLHGGELGARNNPTGGATFWFRIPVDSAP